MKIQNPATKFIEIILAGCVDRFICVCGSNGVSVCDIDRSQNEDKLPVAGRWCH